MNTVSAYGRPAASDRFAPSLRFAQPKKKYNVQFAELVASSQELVYRLALRITRNTEDAEDAQQETMLKVHRKLGQFEGRSRFTTWISRIAINEALMCLRKRRGVVYMPLDDVVLRTEETLPWDKFHSGIEGPEAAYSRKQLRDLLTTAVASLRPANRGVFLLRAIEQLSTVETAEALQISVTTVKTRMHRARRDLRNYLRKARTGATDGMAKPGSDGQPGYEGWLI